jgi:ectoine hydroxylase-related dioxygenase (phytanoyl-CoA dioxygenase family)
MTDAPTIDAQPVPPAMIGALRPSAEATCRRDLERNGYALLRGALDRAAVLAARGEILARLHAVGEIAAPAGAAIATGASRRAELHADLGSFWRSVSESSTLRRVTHGADMSERMSRILGEPAAAFDFVWLRAMGPGRASPLHLDHPYMNRGSPRLLTIWIPLGPVTLADGPVFIIENSHRFADVVAAFAGRDVDRDPTRPGHIGEPAIDFAAQRKARLLTADFAPGDCLVFGMFTVHGSFDNRAPEGRVRLSCDIRYQPAAEPMDERFAGPDPPAHGGKGYGCLSAAQPLTAPLLRR